MHATIWLDQETFTSAVEYCRALSSFRDSAVSEAEAITLLSASGPPDLGGYRISPSGPGASILLHFNGAPNECVRLFELSIAGAFGQTPSVTLHVKRALRRMGLSAVVSYSNYEDHTTNKGDLIPAYTRLGAGATTGTPEERRGVLEAVLDALSLGESLRIENTEGDTLGFVSLDERVAVLTREQARSATERPTLSEGHTAVELSRGEPWVVVYRSEGAAELQRQALAVVEALGGECAKRAQARYILHLEDYGVIYEAARDVKGNWRASFTARRGTSVHQLADDPEGIPASVETAEVGFDVALPVVGETYVGVDAERKDDGGFRYRLRLYRDHESDDERPDIREQRPSQTPEVRGLLPYLEGLEDEALDGVGPHEWVAPAEDLAIEALFWLWGDGRDLLDHEYEE